MDTHLPETLNSQRSLQETSPISSTNDNVGEKEVSNADDVMELPDEDIKEKQDDGDEDDDRYDGKLIYSHWSASWNSCAYADRSILSPKRSPSPGGSPFPEKNSYRGKSPSPEKNPSPVTSPSSGRSPSPDFGTSVVARNKRSLVGAGLLNLGNTCFLNAILQCFTHTVLLVQELCFSDHNCGSGNFCLLCFLRHHIELALTSSGKIISPWPLVENLSYFSSSFRRYRQEDAHEFLQCLLDRLENCCVDSRTHNKEMPLQDYNLVKQIFGGRLISKLHCCNCGHHSDTYESFIDISLEIEHENSLEMALASFTKTEKIGDDTKFNCQNCKEEVLVEKQLMLDQVPQVAALHLKRFKNDGSSVEKIDKHVKFDTDLDLLPYTNGNSEDGRAMAYELYAMVVHSGRSPTSGHYVCFIRSSPDTWHELDDSTVVLADEDWVLCQKAYILFYAKEGTPWLSNMLDTSPKSVLEGMGIIRAPNPTIENSCNLNVCEIEHIGEEKSTNLLAGSRHETERMQMENGESDTRIVGMSKLYHEEVNNDEIEVKEDRDHSQSGNTQEQHGETCGKSLLLEVNCRVVIDSASCIHGTPSRSQKPDIDVEEAQETTHIQRRAEKMFGKIRDEALKDTEKKEAFRTLNLTRMSTSRTMKYLAAMKWSSIRKNRKRIGLRLNKKARSPVLRRHRRRHLHAPSLLQSSADQS